MEKGYRELEDHEILEADDEMCRYPNWFYDDGEAVNYGGSGEFRKIIKGDIGLKAGYFRGSDFGLRRPIKD